MIRPEALEWWLSQMMMLHSIQAEKHISDMPFMAVNTSSCMINRIADAEEKAKDNKNDSIKTR